MPLIFGQKTQRIGIVGRFHAESLPEPILRSVGNGLTSIDEAGIVSPDLAESWESPDKGKTWIFHLKDGGSWQDGEAVVSTDLNY